jgi:two-component system, cell cycle response regulator
MQSEHSVEDSLDLLNGVNDTTVKLLIETSRPCRVLLVDDDEFVRSHISVVLRTGGYEVYTATSGDEALRILDAKPCHIVLTDWQMPDMDGLALCRHLRLLQGCGYIFVLMHTVRSGTEAILAGLSAGADDYVVKGAAAEEILTRLEVGRRMMHLQSSLPVRNDENRCMSVTDPLTGARNRRYLMKYLPREIERAVRDKHPIAVVSYDVDHFKQINDSYGHDVGDEVLQGLVSRSVTVIRRGTDWIARSGGEEFVFVLPDTDLKGASCFAERLQAILITQPIVTATGPLDVTVSIGVTALVEAPELGITSAAEMLRAVNQCVHASKNLGRNRSTAAAPARSNDVLSASRPRPWCEIN